MKELILMRHAKSSWSDSSLQDFDRVLNSRGRCDAVRMAERLAAVATPDLMLVSAAKRASETAELVRATMQLSPAKLRLERSLYLASQAELLAEIWTVSSTVKTLMVVAHNPGISMLAQRLSKSLIPELPTASVVRLRMPVAEWCHVGTHATLIDIDYPKADDL